MILVKKIFILAVMLIIAGGAVHADTGHHQGKSVMFITLGGRGSSTPIGGGLTFSYDFDRSPALGSVIVKVQVFDRAKNRVTYLKITGESGMPSMHGAHDSGEVPFRLSKKGDYLLPVNIVMPGTWEIKLRFSKGHDIIFAGRIEFDV